MIDYSRLSKLAAVGCSTFFNAVAGLIKRYVVYGISLLLPVSVVAEPIHIPNGVIASAGMDVHVVAQFTLFIAILLIGTIFFGKLFKLLFKLPMIAGQIVGGVILGPSLLNIRALHFFDHSIKLVDQASGAVFTVIASDIYFFFVILLSSAITVAYLLWVAGYETDLKDLLRVGGVAVGVGILGALVPIVMIGGTMMLIGGSVCSIVESIGIGIIFSATSVSIPIAMLVANHKMNLRSSQATLGAAIIDDIFAVIILSLFLVTIQAGLFGDMVACADLPETSLGLSLIRMVGAFVLFFIVGYFIIPRVIGLFERLRWFHLIAPTAMIFMLLYFAGAELIGGLAGITGAYFAGLFHRMGDQHHIAEKNLSPFVNAILLPLFLGSIGLQVDVTVLSAWSWVIVILLLIVAIISKFIGTYGAVGVNNLCVASSQRWSWLEGYLFSSSMIPRGEVGLVVASILRGADIINPELYVISVITIVLTTIVSPIMLAVGFSFQESGEASGNGGVEVVLGRFPALGTPAVFNSIVNVLEEDKQYGTAIRFSEGQRIVSLEDHGIKILYSPQHGIVFEGDREKIDAIIALVREKIVAEVEQFTPSV